MVQSKCVLLMIILSFCRQMADKSKEIVVPGTTPEMPILEEDTTEIKGERKGACC